MFKSEGRNQVKSVHIDWVRERIDGWWNNLETTRCVEIEYRFVEIECNNVEIGCRFVKIGFKKVEIGCKNVEIEWKME